MHNLSFTTNTVAFVPVLYLDLERLTEVNVSLHSGIVILMWKGKTVSPLCVCSGSLRCVEITTSVDDASRPCQTSLVTTAMCLAY